MNRARIPMLILCGQGLQQKVVSQIKNSSAILKLGGGGTSRQIHSSRILSFKMSSTTLSPSEQQGSGESDDVVFETVRGKGIIRLNRPKALNALNISMIRKIYPTLREWESSNKKLVIIKAEGGKAFCAGGDIRAVTDSAKAGTDLYKDFFKEEYQLNALIGTLHVPYVALIDGITMGGGVGLSVHGQFRVATEKTLFAMPETAIGLFPDVGGGYFLPRLGGKLGLYLALTGYRLKGADVYKAGIATHMCDSSKLLDLEKELIALDSSRPQDIEVILQKYNELCPETKKAFSLESHMANIDKLFNATSVEQILSNLKSDGSEWSLKTAETLAKMSPTSLKTSFKLLQMGEELDLQECLRVEYRISQRCCENHDFIEGVRALLVDKDQNPQWKPKTLEEVTPDIVDKYFAPLSEDRELVL